MSAVKEVKLISVEEYLKGELSSEVKHEFIDGHIYAMAGASKNHERISGNLYRKFGNHLEHSPCEPFGSDVKIKVNSDFFYPDCMVVCDDHVDNDYYTESPTIIIEVLSRSTRKRDETTKLMSYLNITSLQEYAIIEQDFVDIEIFRKNDNWLPKHYFLGDKVSFEPIGLTLKVEEIYHRVNNEDMIIFLNSKNEL